MLLSLGSLTASLRGGSANEDRELRKVSSVARQQVVPVIDLEAPDVASLLDEACQTVGFFQLHGHGIPGETISSMLRAVETFFRLPLDEKVRVTPSDPDVSRGYKAIANQSVSYSLGLDKAHPDLLESFTMAREEYPEDDPKFAVMEDFKTAFAPNVWPEHPREMRTALADYYAEAERVSIELSRVMAQALDLPEEFFVDKTDHSIDSLRVNYYSASADTPMPEPGQQGLGAHTDYGILTVLYAAPGPGLQIVGPDGEWADVVPVEGCLVVNLGDFMAQWTNDRWRSTLHRVIPMVPEGEGLRERISVPFFRQGNYDLVIECLPTCASPDNPPRYPPVHAGEHLKQKLMGSMKRTPATTVSTVGDRIRAISSDEGG